MGSYAWPYMHDLEETAVAQLDKNAKYSLTRAEDGRRMEPDFRNGTIRMSTPGDSDNQLWRVAVTGQREVMEAGKEVTVDVVSIESAGTPGKFLAAMDPNLPTMGGELPFRYMRVVDPCDAKTARLHLTHCTEWYLRPTGAPDSYLPISLIGVEHPGGKVLVPFTEFWDKNADGRPVVLSQWVDLSAPPAETIWRFRAWG
ncbi:hypothetical protein [Streptomyces lavendofoliae]|uniref:Uncharacterized protein n=1 Tax=Streptomyces lavendofoliae TaxID=67314 RepID=A0A918I4K0_9ACTN|nr:hypothetical protein [Streptomyces lavendofoliae]GGU69407.1 hypothetical protein GCM10010274_66780 [Streptomyces lavendofoliae]